MLNGRIGRSLAAPLMLMESVMLRIAFALAAVAMLATPATAANRCRNAKGHFIACPKPKPAATGKCRNAKGHFVKCGTPGAKPA